MASVRALIRDHRTLVMLLLALALAVKALVPQGYMLGGMAGMSGQKLMTVQLCYDGMERKTVQIAIPTDGRPSAPGQQDAPGHADADSPCAYSALSMASTAGADAPLLALALLFILALGFAPVRTPALASLTRRLPPACGPPLIA